MRSAISFVGVFLLSCGSAAAQPDAQPRTETVDIGRAMDRKLEKVTISSKELPDALAEIGKLVGAKIQVDEAAADLLPWGRQTKLADVTITHASLREALPEILGPLGMAYELRDGVVVVVATKPLKRINRRATWDELKLLQKCRETVYTPEALAELRIQYRITGKVDAPELMKKQLEQASRGTIAQILELATGSLGWVWFPDEDRIVIRTAEAQMANQLSRRVTLHYEKVPLSRILLALADKAEVPSLLEPGVMLKLPPATAQNFTLLVENTSIRQALNLISAETGLKYEMRRDVLYIGLADDYQPPGATSTVAAPRRSNYVGRISVPSEDGSYTYDFLVREDELPDDVLDYRRQIIQQYIEKMRRDMAREEAPPSASGSQP